MTLHACGDSITAGSAASVAGKRYISLLAHDLGESVSNYAQSTHMAFDQWDAIQGLGVTASDKSVVFLGTNDQAKYDAGAVKRQIYLEAMRAIIVRLSAVWSPAAPASGVTFSGVWSNSGFAWGMYGAVAPGAKASFVCQTASVLIGTLRQVGNASTFRIKIGGIDKGTFATAGDGTTLLGRSYGPRGLFFDGLTPGSVVEIEALSANSSNPFYFQWWSDCTPKAPVCVVNIPHAVAYTYGGSSANVDQYNSDLLGVVQKLQEVGLDVSLADVCSILTSADMADNVHPNDSGHQKIADTIFARLGTPVTYDSIGLLLGSDGHVYAGTNPPRLLK